MRYVTLGKKNNHGITLSNINKVFMFLPYYGEFSMTLASRINNL